MNSPAVVLSKYFILTQMFWVRGHDYVFEESIKVIQTHILLLYSKLWLLLMKKVHKLCSSNADSWLKKNILKQMTNLLYNSSGTSHDNAV